jgi:RNA polymerase sigma factor (sigma-70 family)
MRRSFRSVWALRAPDQTSPPPGKFLPASVLSYRAGDTRLALACQRGSVGDGALDVEDLTGRYGPMVLRRCRQLLRDEDEAMDACQDVFLRVIERRDRLDVQYPSSFLYRVATHVSLNRIRDRSREATPTDDELLDRIASAESPGTAGEARSLLDRLFRRHPESSRTIAVLHHLDGLTLEQVAEVVGLSVSGVRKRLRGLRQTLHEWEER